MFISSKTRSICSLGVTFLMVFMIFSAFLVPKAYAAQAIISGSVVNVRSGPGSNYEIIGTLLKDTKVEILSSSGSWKQIKYSALQGWVASEYISSSTPSATQTQTQTQTQTANRQIQVINGPVNIRSGAGTTYETIGTIPDQGIFKILGEENGWYKIQLNDGRSAYVAGWLVKEVTSSTGSTAAPTVTTSSTSAANTSVNVNNSAPTVILNQQKMQFEVPPRIENGRTLVPLRAIFEAMGASVDWNESTRTVTAKKTSTTVILKLGSTTPTVNGQVQTLEVPAKIVNGRTLAPLRFVGEAFGGTVNWDAQTRIINISYTTAEQPKAVKVAGTEVNLRQAPTTAAAKIDSALPGEIMPVLAVKDGWYQVKHGSTTAWVASWVVEATSETENNTGSPAEPETPVVDPTPVPETNNEPENALHLSRTRDASGIKVIISSNIKMDPEIKQGSGNVQYEFTNRSLVGLYYFEEAVGVEKVKAKATSQGQNTLINVDIPSILQYSLSTEDNGKKLIVTVPNTLVGLDTSPFGSYGDRFVLKTVSPVTPTGKITGDKLEVSIPNLTLAEGISHNYSSDLVESMKIEANPSKKSDLLITFNTNELGKYNFAVSGDNSNLNIILMKKMTAPNRSATVVLDAGHGGRDTGARGSLIDEKVVNLAVVLKVGNLLQQKGIKVEYTRTDDSFVELEEISNIANRLNAGLFVSVHCNSSTQSAPGGTETYFYAPLEKPDLYIQRDERMRLASLLQNELINHLLRSNRGVKEGNLSVLRNTDMPSALVELAFLSNPDEQSLLMQDDFQSRAAQAIADGIEAYLNGDQ